MAERRTSVVIEDKIKILLLEKVHKVAEERFIKEGYSVIRKDALSPEELLEIIPKVHGICLRSKTKLPKEVLEKAVNMIVIGHYCIGTDQTDLKKAANDGIPVFNSPYANSRSVAELVIAEMVMLARQAGDRSKEVHDGVWNKKSIGCYEVRGKTLGIIGYGHVGSQLSVLAEAMGLKVIFYDVQPKLALGNATSCDELDDLLTQADFVSLHVPRTDQTKNMMGAEQIKNMKKGSYLLNLSRGTVVDVEAMAEALKSGHLAGGAVDVYPSEPSGKTDQFKTPLQGCPNTILTPHIGGSTEEAQEAIGIEVSSKMCDFINSGSTLGSVNIPNVAHLGPLKPGHTRIVNIHKNVPGVIRAINEELSIGNVVFQALATNDDIGFIIIDVASDIGKQIKDNLAKQPHTIRCYVLFQGPGFQGELRKEPI